MGAVSSLQLVEEPPSVLPAAALPPICTAALAWIPAGADDLLQSEWGRFGVALGGFSRPPLDPAGSQQAQVEQAGGRTSLDGGRKLTRPASLHRIPSMEQVGWVCDQADFGVIVWVVADAGAS